MFRRFARIFCVTVLLLILATAVAAQFGDLRLHLAHLTFFVYRGGMDCAIGHPKFSYGGPWGIDALLEWPIFDTTPPFLGMFLPWWFLLGWWGLPTAAVWWVTRRRGGSGGAFPMEPNVPAAVKPS